MVVSYPSSFQAYRYVVDGESVIVKHHRMFNYQKLPTGIPRPGALASGITLGLLACLGLTDLVSFAFCHPVPDTYNRAYFKLMRERKVRIRENPIRDHKVGAPVRPDTVL